MSPIRSREVGEEEERGEIVGRWKKKRQGRGGGGEVKEGEEKRGGRGQCPTNYLLICCTLQSAMHLNSCLSQPAKTKRCDALKLAMHYNPQVDTRCIIIQSTQRINGTRIRIKEYIANDSMDKFISSKKNKKKNRR